MLSEVRSSAGRSHAVEAPHTRRQRLQHVEESLFSQPLATLHAHWVLGTRDSRLPYFLLTLAPIRNNFLTVPVGNPFI
jgi:hypothetical protein